MGKPKAGCTCDRSLRRALFLSPIFLTIFICFWAAYSVLPLSISLWRDCSSDQKHANCNILANIRGGDILLQPDGVTSEVPLNLRRSLDSSVPAKPLIDVVESNDLLQHNDSVITAAPPDVGESREEDSISHMQNSIQNQNHQQYEQTSEEIATDEVVRLMQDLRSAASLGGNNETFATINAEVVSDCNGRRAYIYDLPAKFNVDLLTQCHRLIPWQNMCEYVSNSGMGRLLDDHPTKEGLEEVLVPAGVWYQTHQYALEIIFHERLKQYSCLVTSPEDADMFYIPYYGGFDVLRWHFVKDVTNAQRDQLGLDLVRWLKEQPTWSKNKGADHVLVLGKISWDFRRWPTGDGWGSSLLLQEEMQNLTKLLIERQPWHPHDVGVPHPTFFHPRHDRDIRTWQGHIDGVKRRHLVSFAGQPRPQQTESIRSHLIKQCLSSITGPSTESSCYFLQCGGNTCLQPNTTMDLFIHSEFCLQPPGDSPTRRSIFDSLIAGCIPVLFDPYSAYYQYPWHLPADPKAYSVYFPAEDVREGKINVIDELRKIPKSIRREMRLRIIYSIMPGLVYARPGARLREVEDAFLISLRSLFSRISERLDSGVEEA